MKRIKQKVKAGKTHVVEDTGEEKVEKVQPTKVVDLLPLLRESLAKQGRKLPRAKKSRAKVKERHETAG